MLKKIDNSIRQTIANSVETAKPYVEGNFCVRLAYITFALIVITIVVIVYILIIVPTLNNKTNGINNGLSPTQSPTAANVPLISQIGFYHTSGNQMVDIYGKTARISSVNWNGFETVSFIAEGLAHRNFKFLLDDVKKIGFNTIRIPFSNQMFLKSSATNNIDYNLNKEFFGLSPLECLDLIVKYCGIIGLRVILTRSSAIASNNGNEDFWYIPNDAYYTESQFISDWMMLAMRFKGTAVLGADLWDRPQSTTTWGTGNGATDWNQAVVKTGDAILALNPQWLIFVTGINSGTDLRGVMKNPIKLRVANKIIYTAHVISTMSTTGGAMTTQSASSRTDWNQLFGFIVANQVAPVCVVVDGSGDWLSSVINYVNGYYTQDSSSDLPPGHTGLEISFSALNPSPTYGGIFLSDWKTPSINKIAYVLTTFSPLLLPPFVPNADPSKTIGNLTSLVPKPTVKPTIVSQLQVSFGYLHTSGNQIVDSFGKAWRISGVNWDGFDGSNNIVEGLRSRNYKAIINQIKTIGFNCIRLSFSNQMLISSVVPSAVDYFTNPDLIGLSPLQCLDKIILYCGSIGLRVILVRVSSKSGNMNNEVSWYIPNDPYYTEERYIIDWAALALRYKGTAVIGADLWNEPSNGVTWGTYELTDWNKAAERVGNEILAVNPQWIIFVQGINRGRDLTCVKTQQIKLSRKNKLVYSTNLYSIDPSAQSLTNEQEFPYNIRNYLNTNFAYILDNQIAPLYVSALGTSLTKSSDSQWLSKTIIYLNGVGNYLFDDDNNMLPDGHVGISWSYSALNPSGYVSGLLSSDWFTPYSSKLALIKPALAPLLVIPYVANADPTRSINNVTSIIAAPTLKPTTIISSSPTIKPTSSKSPINKPSVKPTNMLHSLKPLRPIGSLGYFHTSGNQIVDSLGKNWRVSAVIWAGFETTANIPQGLWTRNYTSLIDQAKRFGFNTIYIPFSNEMLRSTSKTSGIDYSLNSEMLGSSPLECLDYIVNYCGYIGLKVILLRKSAKADNFFSENTWYIPGDSYYSEQRIIQDWAMLASRYRDSAVIGADLWNQPRGNVTWGSGTITDWNKAAERIGNAILNANPQWLVLMQGITWGSDISSALDYPVQLLLKNKIVYVVQQYTNDASENPLFDDPTFPNNLKPAWNEYFGIVDQRQIAPVMIVFGTSLATPEDRVWMKQIVNYINGHYFNDSINSLYPGHVGMSWIYFKLNPYGPTGGLLESDWNVIETPKIVALKSAMAPLLVPSYIPNADPSNSIGNVTSVVPFPSISPTIRPQFGYFHTSGNQIVDSTGKAWKLTGLNWYGFEGIDDVIQGLWLRNYKSIIDQAKSLGFNHFRIPYSNHMLREEKNEVKKVQEAVGNHGHHGGKYGEVKGVWYGVNKDLKGLSPLQVLDKIIEYCGIVNMRVILDRHSSYREEFTKESYWYIPGDPYYTEERFIVDWVMLAKRYKNTAVIGADVWNEPKMFATWGTGNLSSDWRLAAERAGNAILDANPDWLIFVEGVGGATWWGGDLRGVRKHPVRLKYPNKLVYSTHEYCQDVKDQSWFNDAWFPENLRAHWDDYFGYIYKEEIAPLWVGEFGTRFAYPFDKPWLEKFVKYISGEFYEDGVNSLPPGREGPSWCFWALNPLGDTGGLLEADWITVDEYKLAFIKPAMAPMLNPPIDPNANPFYSYNNVSFSLVPQPSLNPTFTASPTIIPTFNYLSTFGNQIVDHNGIPIRLHAINWYGFDTSSCIPHGLWSQKYTVMIQIMQRVGFDTIRIPFASEMLRVTNTTIKSVNYKQNPSFHGRTPLQVLDLIVQQAGLVGMKVILDRHSILFDNLNKESFWYLQGSSNYTEEDFISDWLMLAQRYKGTAVIGAELWTEPRGNATWGTGLSTDWKLMAERVGNAIHEVNPDWLIFVQGVTSTDETWLGGDLRKVKTDPIALIHQNKLVYSIREFGPDMEKRVWFDDPSFQHNLRDRWNEYFGFLLRDNIAPVFISEFGTALSKNDKRWLSTFMNYMNGAFTTPNVTELTGNQVGLSFGYWSVSPFGPVGGIFQFDFWAVDYPRLDYLSPILLPFQNNKRPTRRLSLH